MSVIASLLYLVSRIQKLDLLIKSCISVSTELFMIILEVVAAMVLAKSESHGNALVNIIDSHY